MKPAAPDPAGGKPTAPRPSLVARAIAWGVRFWNYFNSGVWEDSDRSFKVAFLKTLNLSMRSFMSSQIQVRAASLTYNTVLAVVPALALVFAICRGFGFQNMLEGELMHYFPAQREVITQGLQFVDSYLTTASEGVFVGAGILFLLWTLFSLMSNVEDAFNQVWGVRLGRSYWRKFTDYMAIFFLLPILMICSSGITIVMSSALRTLIPWGFLSSAVSWILDLLSLALIWLFFTGTYMMVPNTKVSFRSAFIAGVVAGTLFMVLQWLFVSGQLYVSKYNAIYGSFSFLPLFLIWLQLVWMITLIGAVMCYSIQNIYNIAYINKVDNISIAYTEKVSIAVMAIIVTKFRDAVQAPTLSEIAHQYRLPANLLGRVVDRLITSGLVKTLSAKTDEDEPGLVPSRDIDYFTIKTVMDTLRHHGDEGFIPGFKSEFGQIDTLVTDIYSSIESSPDNIPLYKLTIKP